MKPILKEIYTDLDVFDIYSIFKDSKDSILLESGLNQGELGRYSYIGINPFSTFKWQDGVGELNGVKFEVDGVKYLAELLDQYKFENTGKIPFISGAIGYFSYDFARSIEEIPSLNKKDVDIPQCYFNFYDNIIIIDHEEKKTYISACGELSPKEKSISIIENKILNSKKVEYSTYPEYEEESQEFIPNFTKDKYIKTLKKVRQYIENGDIYITNLTQSFKVDTKKTPYETYKKLRYINPAPFSAYMNLDKFAVVSSSPEQFLKIENRIVQTRPIKGTSPRGETLAEDTKYKLELLASEKERAELLMIVDLERNDLSKVCKPNSVKVKSLYELEKYSTVYHLSSTIEGELKDEFSSMDCIKACFPGGSITGAPKIRSMEIIEELEPTMRNIYTGCIGYLGFDGNVELNIVIRTILMKDSKAYFGVGGGITFKSKEEDEYDETLIKAKALMVALRK